MNALLHDPMADEIGEQAPCLICNGGNGLCDACMAAHEKDAKALNNALDAVSEAARVRWGLDWQDRPLAPKEAHAITVKADEAVRKAVRQLLCVCGVSL